MSSSDAPREQPDPEEEFLPPPGPTDYNSVPLLRRNGFCSAVLLAHLLVILLGCCVAPIVSLFGIFTSLGVIVVCVTVLTGPIYYNKRKKDGTLKTWSAGNKVAAVIILILFVGGYVGLLYNLYSSGKIG